MKIMKNNLKKFLMKYGEYIKMNIIGMKKQKVKMDLILGISMGSLPLYTEVFPNCLKLSGFVDHTWL